MISYLVRSHLYIPYSEFTPKMKKRLTIINPDIKRYHMMGVEAPEGVTETYRLYKADDNKKFVRIPKFALGSLKELAKTNKVIMDNPDIEIDIQLKWDFQYNDSQNKTLADACTMLLDEYGAVIVADPGEGKTLMAIGIICFIKRKTLILVHKDFLVNQWRDALLKHTNLKKEEIGLIKAGKFKDGKVVIGTQQSLMRGTVISSEVNKLFSFKIQDETHRIGATMFLRSYTRFNTKYCLGLSATPDREDGLEELYFLHTSNNLIMHSASRNIKASYYRLVYASGKSWIGYHSYMPYRIQVLKNLLADETRNNMIMKVIVICMSQNRKVLLIGEYVKKLFEFMHHLQQQFPNYKVVRFFGNPALTKKDRREGVSYEKYKDPNAEELLAANIIVATYKKAMEGIDIPNLDTVVGLTPLASKVGLKQVIGRAERKYDGKKSPLVIDVVDTNNNWCINLANKRSRLYEEWGMHMYDGKEFDDLSNKSYFLTTND